MLMVWAVGEDLGGPYTAGSTAWGMGIVYLLLFVTLLTFASSARPEWFRLDQFLERRLN